MAKQENNKQNLIKYFKTKDETFKEKILSENEGLIYDIIKKNISQLIKSTNISLDSIKEDIT